MWCAAEEQFDELCFEYGIELDDVVGEGGLQLVQLSRVHQVLCTNEAPGAFFWLGNHPAL